MVGRQAIVKFVGNLVMDTKSWKMYGNRVSHVTFVETSQSCKIFAKLSQSCKIFAKIESVIIQNRGNFSQSCKMCGNFSQSCKICGKIHDFFIRHKE